MPEGGSGHPDHAPQPNENRLSLALGAADIVGIWDGDLIGGRVYGDDTFARMYGVDPVMAARGVPLGFYIKNIHPDDVPAVRAEMDRLYEGGGFYANEHRIMRPTGAVRWVLTRGRLVRDEQGRPARFAGISVDITERKQAETRQAFLLTLADRLRTLASSADVVDTAVTLLGRHLGVSRAGYSQVQADDITLDIRGTYTDGVRPSTGLIPMDVFGADNVARHRQGLTIVHADIAADPAGAPPIFAAIGTRALVSVPLIRDGRFCATLYVSQSAPRDWTAEEVALIQDVAARIWDAGERLRVEAALRASEAQFRGFAQAMPNHVWTSGADGLTEWCNDRTYQFTGLGPDDLAGPAWGRIVHPDDQPSVMAQWMACVEAGKTYETEFRIRRYDGVYRWHLSRAEPIRGPDGQITRWLGTSTDIDDQKTATRALAELNDTLEQRVLERTHAARLAEARFRGIFDSTYQLIGLTERDGTILEVNRAVLDAGQLRLEDLVGLKAWEAPWFRQNAAAAATLQAAFPAAAGGSFVRHELEMVQPDGRMRAYDFSLNPVRDEHNEIAFLVIEGRDITERKHLEEQLRQSQKMEAVGQLTGGLAHDFNNLLTGITGSLELLRTRLSQGRLQDAERYMAAASGAAERAAALTHRLLAFSRRQTLDARSTNIDRLVSGMEDLVRRTAGPAIRVEVVATPDLWNTMVDPHQLENALLNLCINARDAMPDGGTLTVRTGNEILSPAAAGALDLPAGAYVFLSVSDTGTGMEPEVVARAFDPFFTTKPLGMGTGLGLSMTYGFVRQSGGQARIDSQLGRGTTVTLHLPRHTGDEPAAAVASASGPAPNGGWGQTVLVVDDEPTVRMLVAEVLADLDYTALEAADGPEALKLLDGGQRIDLLITDVGLPGGMNGRQLADAARTGRPDLKVLFITGYAETAVIGEGHLEPGMHVMTKPFTMDALARGISQIVGGR